MPTASEFSEAGRPTLSHSFACQSVRPVANIDSKSHANPTVPGGDRQYDLYDKLLQPFDDSEDCESHFDSSANRADNANDNHDNNIVDDTCEHDAHSTSNEAVEARIANAPKRPSQAEVDAHMTTHLPFRSWCPHCARGIKGQTSHAQYGRERDTNHISELHVHA